MGGNVGYASARSKWVYRNNNPYDSTGPATPIFATDNTFNMSSIIGGAQAGCNYEFDSHLVVGLEASWSGANLHKSIPNVVQIFGGSTQTVETTINSMYTVAGRFGYAFTPDWLAYVKGGFASARIETSGQTNPGVGTLNLNWSTSHWNNGFVAGAGGEYKLTPNVIVGVEYDYIGLETSDQVGAVSGGGITPANQVVHGVNANIQSVTARLSWLFGSAN